MSDGNGNRLGPLTVEEWQEFIADFAQLSDIRKHVLMEHIRHVAALTAQEWGERVWQEPRPVARVLGSAAATLLMAQPIVERLIE